MRSAVVVRLCLWLALSLCVCADLAPKAVLRVGVVIDPPYVQREIAGTHLTGASIELVTLLSEALGQEVSWQVFDSAAALEAARSKGQVDLVPAMPQTPDALRYWRFSEPALRTPVKLVGRRGLQLASLDELVGLSAALQKGSPVERFVSENFPAISQLPAPNDRLALDQVVAGAADVAIIDAAHARELVGRGDYLGLEVIGDAGYALALRVAVRPAAADLVPRLDRVLAAMPAERLLAIQRRWLTPIAPPAWNSKGFWEMLSMVLMLALLLSLIGFAWQRSRWRESQKRLLSLERGIAALEATEAALRLAQFSLDHTTVGVLWLNWDGRVRYANGAAEAMHGYPAGALLERPLALLDPTMTVQAWLSRWQAIKQEGSAATETEHLRLNGSRFPADVRLSYLRFGKTEYVIVFIADATERRRAREALEKSEASLRDLAAHIETVREEEKARIAREVHDELGQVLTGLRLEISMAAQVWQSQPAAYPERLANMTALVDQTFQIVRAIVTELRPAILNAGLPSALDWLARRFEERYGIPLAVTRSAHIPELPDATAIALFRITQEALTNIARYAEAQSVRIDLTVSDGILYLAIEDDGRGFLEEEVRSNAFGLIGMRERAIAIGGDFEVHSRLGEGSDVHICVRLEPLAKDSA